MKKLGLICMSLVLALGALGVGYAMWSDTLTIDGTVTTGDVDIDLIALSGTWLYKDTVEHTSYVHHGWGTLTDGPLAYTPGGDETLITWAAADMNVQDADGVGYQSATVEVRELLPCTYFMVDFLIHYDGSIPARLKVDIIPDVGWLADLWEYARVNSLTDVGAGVLAYEWNEPSSHAPADRDMTCYDDTKPIDLEGYQMHGCEWILVKLWIHIPQEDPDLTDEFDLSKEALEGRPSTSFTATVEAQQWNKYVE